MAGSQRQQKLASQHSHRSETRTESVACDYDTSINRIAAFLAKRLRSTPLTPTHLSVLGLSFGLAAGILFAFGEQKTNNFGAIMFMLAVFMDELDGALARDSGRVTRFGHLLDYVAGTVSFCALFIGTGIGLQPLIGASGPILGIAAAFAALLAMSIRMGMEDRHGRQAVKHKRFGPFELKNGIYLIGPITLVGGLYWFFVAAALSTCIFAFWTVLQRKLWLRGAAQLRERRGGIAIPVARFVRSDLSDPSLVAAATRSREARGTTKTIMIVFGLIGLALATGLIVWQGAGAVIQATLGIGWGLVAVIASHAIPLSIDAAAWGLLLPAGSRLRFVTLLRLRWIRQSVSHLLPVAQIGGEAVGARMMYLAGVPGDRAGAAVVVDLTLAVTTQVLFTLFGLALLGTHSAADDLTWPLLVVAGALLFGISGSGCAPSTIALWRSAIPCLRRARQ